MAGVNLSEVRRYTHEMDDTKSEVNDETRRYASAEPGRRSHREFRADWIGEIARNVLEGRSLQQIIDYTVAELSSHFPDFRSAYSTVDENGTLAVLSSVEPHGMPALRGLRADLTHAPDYLRALRSGTPLAVSDVEQEPIMVPLVDSMKAGKTRALLDVPVTHSSILAGLLCLDSPHPHRWSSDEITTLQEIADALTLAIQAERSRTALKERENRLRAFVRAMPDLNFVIDENGRVLEILTHEHHLLHRDPDQLRGAYLQSALPAEVADLILDAIRRCIDSSTLQRVEFSLDVPAGHRWFEARTTPTEGEADGPRQVLMVARDVTERIESEQRVASLLREQELLLRETHHRIKNNMSTIGSLLNLQSSRIDTPECSEVLRDAAGRVQSMMVLYDRLYRSELRRRLSLREYLPPLVEEIVELFRDLKQVRTELDLPEVELSPKVLSPLGIILNELITNSIKHAFIDVEDPVIRISVTADEAEITVVYVDNGDAEARSMDVEQRESFGMQLIQVLVEQILGEVTVRRDRGSPPRMRETVIRFPRQ